MFINKVVLWFHPQSSPFSARKINKLLNIFPSICLLSSLLCDKANAIDRVSPRLRDFVFIRNDGVALDNVGAAEGRRLKSKRRWCCDVQNSFPRRGILKGRKRKRIRAPRSGRESGWRRLNSEMETERRHVSRPWRQKSPRRDETRTHPPFALLADEQFSLPSACRLLVLGLVLLLSLAKEVDYRKLGERPYVARLINLIAVALCGLTRSESA